MELLRILTETTPWEWKKGQTLVFSYIGFVTQEIVVADQKTLNVEMKEDTETLEEVVVVGMAFRKRNW